jgi:hypothetical protein
LIESTKILPYEGDIDKNRLLSAFRREKADRVPNFEILNLKKIKRRNEND